MNRSRGALRYEWTRIQLTLGTIVYVARVTNLFAFNVWRKGSYWKWVLASTKELSTEDTLILAWGEAPTMREAKLRAEAWANTQGIEAPQSALPLFREDMPHATDLPF